MSLPESRRIRFDLMTNAGFSITTRCNASSRMLAPTRKDHRGLRSPEAITPHGSVAGPRRPEHRHHFSEETMRRAS